MEQEQRQFTAQPPAYTSCGQPVPPRANPQFGPGSRSALRAAGRVVKRSSGGKKNQQLAVPVQAVSGGGGGGSEEEEDELGPSANKPPVALIKELQTIRPYSRKKGCGWTKDEDKLLTDAVAIYGDVTGQWSRIAEMIPGRSSKVCRKRWFFCLNPAVRKGPFTAQEDAQLIALFKVHGPAWALIALSIPGRTDDSCAKRYRECLDPSIVRGGWSPSEDEVLKEGVGRYGSQWSQICLMPGLEGRKGLHCRNRWRTLSKDLDGRGSGSKRKSLSEAASSTRLKRPSSPLSIVQSQSPDPPSSSSTSTTNLQPVFTPSSCQRLTDLLALQPAAQPVTTPDDSAIQSLLTSLAKEWATSTGSQDPLSVPSTPREPRSLEAFCEAITKATTASGSSSLHTEPNPRFVPDALWDAISKSLARPIGLQDVAPEALTPRSSYLPNLLQRTDLSATLPYLDISTLPNFSIPSPSPPTSPEAPPSASASASPPNQFLDDAFLSRILSDNYPSSTTPTTTTTTIKSIMSASDASWPAPPVQTLAKFDWQSEHQNGLNPLWDAWMTGIAQPPPSAAAPQEPTISTPPASHLNAHSSGQHSIPPFSFSPWLTHAALPTSDDS